MSKQKPIITYTEILSRAIKSLDAEIWEIEEMAKKFPEMEQLAAPLREKREAVNTLYCIETGCDYE